MIRDNFIEELSSYCISKGFNINLKMGTNRSGLYPFFIKVYIDNNLYITIEDIKLKNLFATTERIVYRYMITQLYNKRSDK